MSEAKTAVERLAEKKRAREAKDVIVKASLDEQIAEQAILDEDAFEKFEDEIGKGKVARVFTPYFVQGLPTFIVVRSPESKYAKRYKDMVRRAGQDEVARFKAIDLLAEACIVYPDEKGLPAVLNEWSSTLAAAFVKIIKLSDLTGEEEKKA